jgi:small subunit ribosomal protein S2
MFFGKWKMVGRNADQLQNHSGRNDRLNEIKAMETDGTLRSCLKRSSKLRLELERLEKFLGGIKKWRECRRHICG